jgi:hypothetical protein
MKGFWSQEMGTVTAWVGAEATSSWLKGDSPWITNSALAIENGISGGVTSRLGRKTFGAESFAGFASSVIGKMLFEPAEKALVKGVVINCYSDLQPKITATGKSILPLDHKRGYWAQSVPWEILY